MPRALCAVFVAATAVVLSDQACRAAAQTPAPQAPQAPAEMTPGDAAVAQVIAHHLRELTEGQTRRTVKALDLLAGRAVGGGAAPFDSANFDVDGTVNALFAACDSFATTATASSDAAAATAADLNRYRASINSLYVNTTDGVGASLRCPVEGPNGVYSLVSSGRLTGVRVPDRRLVPDFRELSTRTLETVYYLLRRPPPLHTPRYPRYAPSSAAAAGSFDVAAEPWHFADGTGGGGVRELTDAVGTAAEAMIVADVCVAGDVDVSEAAYEPCVAASGAGASPRRATVGVSFSFAETAKYLAAVVQGGAASARGGLRPVNLDGAFKGVVVTTQTGIVYASSAGPFVDTQTGLPLNLFSSVVSWLTAGAKPALTQPVSNLVGAIGVGMKTLASENTRVLDGKEPNESDLQFMLRPDILQGIFNNECRRSTVAFSNENCRGLLTKSGTVGDDITYVKAHYPRNSASATSGNWSGAVPLTPQFGSKSASRIMIFTLSTQGGAVGVPGAATRLVNVRNTLSNTVALTADAALATLHSVAGAVADVYNELPRSDARVQALQGLAGLCTAGYFWNPHKAVEEGTVLRGVALATEEFFYYVRCGGAASRVAAGAAGYAASQVAVANRTSGELRVWSGVHLTAGAAFDEAAAPAPVVTGGFDLEALEWWKDVKPPAPAGSASAPNGGRNAAATPVWSGLGATALGPHAAADGGSVLLARPLCAGGAAMPRRTPEEEAARRSERCAVFSGAVAVEADFSLLQEELNEHGGALGAGMSKKQAATLAAGGTLSVPPLTAGVLLVTPAGDLVPVRSRSARSHAEYDDSFVDDLPDSAHAAAQTALRAHAAAGNPGVLATAGYSSVEASVPPNLPPNPPPHHPGVPSHMLPPCADVLTDPDCAATLLYDTAALPLPAGGRVAASAAGAAGTATWKFVTWNPRAYINSYADGSAGASAMATMARLETVLYGTLATATATTEVQRHEDTLMRHAARLARAGVSLRDAQALTGGGGAASTAEDVSVPVDRVVSAQLATCEEDGGGGDGATSVLLYQRQPAKSARYVRTRCAFGAGGRRVSVQANATAPLEEFVVAEHPGFAVQAGPVYVRPEYGAAARELAVPTLPEVPGRVAAGVNATDRVATLSLAAFPKRVEAAAAAAAAATAGRAVARNMSTLGGLLTKPLCDKDPCPRCSSEECPEVHGYATAYVDLSSVEAVLRENQYIIAAYAHMPNDTTALGPTDVTNLLSRSADTLATGQQQQQQGLDATKPTVLVAASRGASLDVGTGTFISPLQSADAAVRETAALRKANATSGTVDGRAAWVVGVPLGWTLTEGRRPWELVVSVDYERYRRDHLNLVRGLLMERLATLYGLATQEVHNIVGALALGAQQTPGVDAASERALDATVAFLWRHCDQQPHGLIVSYYLADARGESMAHVRCGWMDGEIDGANATVREVRVARRGSLLRTYHLDELPGPGSRWQWPFYGAVVNRTEGYQAAAQPWFQAAVPKQNPSLATVVQPGVEDTGLRTFVLPVAKPLCATAGEPSPYSVNGSSDGSGACKYFAGVAGVEIAVSLFIAQSIGRLGLGVHGHAFLFTSSGALLASSDLSYAANMTAPDAPLSAPVKVAAKFIVDNNLRANRRERGYDTAVDGLASNIDVTQVRGAPGVAHLETPYFGLLLRYADYKLPPEDPDHNGFGEEGAATLVPSLVFACAAAALLLL